MPFISARVLSVVRADAIAALAFAGPNQSVLCASLVQLEASIIGDDIENHTFEWEQTFGTPVTLINPNTLTPSFVNPQVSDLEFTFYLDRNTPFEDSDVVIVSRAPTDFLTTAGGGNGTIGISGFASAASNVSGLDQNLVNLDAHVSGWAFTNPPTARYSPIFTAEDLDRVRENLSGDYWLMRDIDLSEYPNWDPLGDFSTSFTGELQGNGFVIDNMTITDRVQNSGLFGHSGGGALIENLGLTNINVSGQTSAWYSAGLIGNGSDTGVFDGGTLTVRNCYVEGVIASGGDRAGGLIGYTGANPNTLFENNYADVTVTGGGGRTAGFVGFWDNTIATAIENYGNTTKTALVAGSLGDVPGATEVEGRTTDQLLLIDFYTGWDFVTIWDGPGGTYHDQLLLHMDGADESTAFIDSSTFNVTPLDNFGATDMDDTQAKFGATAMFNGTSDSGNGLEIPLGGNSPGDYLLFAGAFTVECWFYQTADTEFSQSTLISRVYTGDRGDTTDSAFELGVDFNSINGGLYTPNVLTFTNETGWHQLITGTETTLLNVWNHVAVTRDSNFDLRLFVNGVLSNEVNAPGVAPGPSVQRAYIGASAQNASRRHSFRGWIDEVRVTDGLARYLDDFTPPDAPFVAEVFTEETASATLQRDITVVRKGGFCDDNWMVIWSEPTKPNTNVNAPTYTYKGAIIEENVAGNWSFPRFIPKERLGALMTPATTHRLTSVWDFSLNTSQLISFPPTKELQILNDTKFTSKETSDNFGPYANDSVVGMWGGGQSSLANVVITISNPRKITMQQEETKTYGLGGGAGEDANIAILRAHGVQMPLVEDAPATYGIGGAYAADRNLVIVRANGASIG